MDEIKIDKNPYRDKKFREVVADFKKQGLEQLKLEDVLQKLIFSEEGKYLKEKLNQLDKSKSKILFNGIHGISHSNRVAILSILIAQQEGIFADDSTNRAKDILISAAYIHDIGRKKGPIVVNNGPHAKSSAKKINKMDLKFLNGKEYSKEDKRMLQAIVEAHEAKDKDMEAICKKYKVSIDKIDYIKKIMIILKDADALDRVRLDINLPFMMKTDLDPDYLRTNSSKQLINASYELEALLKNAKIEEILSNEPKKSKEDKEESTFSGIFEKVKLDNYKLYNEKYQREGKINTKSLFVDILNNYLQNIIPEKSNIHNVIYKAEDFAKRAIEHLTGNYQIGIGDVDFEELIDDAETISSIIAYSNNNELNEMLQKESVNDLADGVIDGVVANNLISSESGQEKAKNNFESSSEKVKTFFLNSIYNITHLNTKVANIIAHITKMDTEESKELNTNLFGKAIGGILYEYISGTLEKKRYFTDVKNSSSILEKIENEGILHFASPATIDKIMESQKIKKSNFIESDLTKRKSFFFAGKPTFENLLINIPAYDVMTAIKIKPTAEQINDLKYRAINDRAVVKDGDFRFNKEQAEIVYYGLKFDEENKHIYLGELTEEEVKKFKVSDKVRKAYHYDGKKSTLAEKAKKNIYGFYAEYKHHQKLLQMEKTLRENKINGFKNVNDRTLVELSDIEQAYIDTKDASVERTNLMALIKSKIKIKDKDKEKYKSDNQDITTGEI